MYIRAGDHNKDTKTNLMCAKTIVASIKQLTISRIELSTAVLGPKLVQHDQRALDQE